MGPSRSRNFEVGSRNFEVGKVAALLPISPFRFPNSYYPFSKGKAKLRKRSIQRKQMTGFVVVPTTVFLAKLLLKSQLIEQKQRTDCFISRFIQNN